MNKEKVHEIIVDSPLGHLGLTETKGSLTHCYCTTKPLNLNNISPLLREAKKQLTEYFQGKRQCFDLPLAPSGTLFQQKVWLALLEIPYGETRSYQQIAERIKQNLACRAVGSANGKNPIGIIIPCHRVIRASGELGGYYGGVHRKKKLLALELRGQQLMSGRVAMMAE